MNQSYLRKLIQYMKKTFKIEDRLKQLKDTRVNPRYSTAQGILPVLLGFLIRIQSFNELKYRLKSNDFKGVLSRKMKLPQIDAIRETLKKIDLTGLRDITTSIIKKAKLKFVKFSKKVLDERYSQVLVVTIDFGKITKQMPEKEWIWLIEKEMYRYKETIVFNTC